MPLTNTQIIKLSKKDIVHLSEMHESRKLFQKLMPWDLKVMVSHSKKNEDVQKLIFQLFLGYAFDNRDIRNIIDVDEALNLQCLQEPLNKMFRLETKKSNCNLVFWYSNKYTPSIERRKNTNFQKSNV